jgi:hypothetical protein
LNWTVPRDKWKKFEDMIIDALRSKLATRDGTVKVEGTPIRDRGRDAIITFSKPIMFAGRKITPRHDEDLLHVECKSTAANRIDDAFLADHSQHDRDKLAAYALVTNATITPSLHYRASSAWESNGAEFILLDQFRLWNWLFREGRWYETYSDVLPKAPPTHPVPRELVAYAQPERILEKGEHVVETYVVIRNYDKYPHHIHLTTAANIEWESDIDLEQSIEPYTDVVHRLRSRQQVFGLSDELKMTFTSDGRSSFLSFKKPESDLVLEPPYIGTRVREQSESLQRAVSSNDGFQIISVEGEAGVGKTRLIAESLKPLEKGALISCWAYCDADSGRFDFTNLVGIAAERKNYGPNEIDEPKTIQDAVTFAVAHELPLTLVLEDLHHGQSDDIRAVKELIQAPPNVTEPISLIVTGRNDHTFPNIDYYALLEFEENDHAKKTMVKPLNSDDAVSLILAIAYDLPEAAIERIFSLGQCNPFIIIEALQLLLDTDLALLLSRNTIGVSNPERFVGVEGLPETVQELYDLRLNALASVKNGEEALCFLCYMSFVGLSLSIEKLESFLSKRDVEAISALLRARRFLKFIPKEGRVSFVHENLLHATRKWMRSASGAQARALRLLEREVVREMDDRFQLGEIYVLAGLMDEAFELFTPIWQRVQRVTNFSSEEIDRSYFAHLPALFEAAKSMDMPKGGLARVLRTMGYMGIHNFTLYQGERACEDALAKLYKLFPTKKGKNLRRDHEMALKQLQAHALQNMGRTVESFRKMSELQADILYNGHGDPTVEYDLFDRLQTHYCRANHAELTTTYSKLAQKAVKQANDDRLKASHLISQSLMHLYDKKKAMNAAKEALESAENTGIRRFEAFNKLTMLVARAHHSSGGRKRDHKEIREELSDIHAQAKELLRYTTLESFPDSIVRLHLLLATVCLHVHDKPDDAHAEALAHIRAGRDAAVRFGLGLFDWGLANLSGVVHLAANATDQAVLDEFKTCMDRLQWRSLTFVGAQSGLYPSVLAITNIIRYRASISQQVALDILMRRVTGYEADWISDRQTAFSYVLKASKGEKLFWPKLGGLRYPGDNGYFTPVF